MATRSTLILLLVVVSTACSRREPRVKKRPVAAPTSRVPAPAPSQKQFIAVIAPKHSAEVVSELDARIEKVLVSTGTLVEQDTPLIKLNEENVRTEVAAAEARYKEAQAMQRGAAASLAEARRKAQVSQQLLKEGLVSSDELARLQAETSQASARRDQAAATADIAGLALERVKRVAERATIVAPMAGVVSTLNGREGDIAARGSVLLRIFDPTNVTVRFAIATEDALKPGARVQFTNKTDGKSWSGTVTSIGAELESPLQLMFAEAELDAQKDVPLPGAVGRVIVVQ